MYRLKKVPKRTVRAAAAATLMSGLLVPIIGASPANAVTDCSTADIQWSGATDTNWNVDSNWVGGTQPTLADSVCIPEEAVSQPEVSTTEEVASLESETGTTVEVATSGDLTLAGPSTVESLSVTGGTVTTNDVLTVETLLTFESGTIDGTGEVVGLADSSFDTVAAKTFDVDFTNEGDLAWNDGDVTVNGTLLNNGTFDALGTGDTLTATALTNAGQLNAIEETAATVTLDTPSFINNGSIAVGGDTTVLVDEPAVVSQDGTLTVGEDAAFNTAVGGSITQTLAGTLTVNGSITTDTLTINDGILSGSGAVTGDVVVNGGTVQVAGAGVGALSVDGDYTQSDGVLEVEATGTTTPVVDYDQLAVTGAVNLSGTAVLDVTATPESEVADAYDFISYTSVTGTYSDITSNLPVGLVYEPTYGATELTLTAAVAEPGSISGTVYEDLDGNAAQDVGESGLEGIDVYVDVDESGSLNAGDLTAVTDVNGDYLLEEAPVGIHDVMVDAPAGYVQTQAATGVEVEAETENTGNDIGLAPVDPEGYWLNAIDGGIFTFSNMDDDSGYFHGSRGGQSLNAPIVDVEKIPGVNGYWMVAADGGVFTYTESDNDSQYFYGSMGGQSLNSPVVGISAMADGSGYWLGAADGGVFTFTSNPSNAGAKYYGSMGGQPINSPVVDITSNGTGTGYWLVAADGGVFTFTVGNAAADAASFYGSMGGQRLNSPVVGMEANVGTEGYRMVAADGGIFSFAPGNTGGQYFYGSQGGQPLNSPVVDIAPMPDGTGYWLAAADGGVFTFTADPADRAGKFYGSQGGKPLNFPVIGITSFMEVVS